MVDFHPENVSHISRWPLLLYVLSDLSSANPTALLSEPSGRFPGRGQLLFPGRGFHSTKGSLHVYSYKTRIRSYIL